MEIHVYFIFTRNSLMYLLLEKKETFLYNLFFNVSKFLWKHASAYKKICFYNRHNNFKFIFIKSSLFIILKLVCEFKTIHYHFLSHVQKKCYFVFILTHVLNKETLKNQKKYVDQTRFMKTLFLSGKMEVRKT